MKKQELLNALEKVKPGLANKDMVEQATSFAFMNSRVITFNDNISISYALPDLNITGAVKADELYKFLSKVKEDDIDLICDSGEIRIKSGKAKAGLSIEADIKLPLNEVGAVGKFTPLPSDFISILDTVRFCCSKDMSKAKLTCVHIRKDGMMEACDNFRAIRVKMKSGVPDNFLLPESSASALVNYQIESLSLVPGWAHFANKDQSLIFSCRVYSEQYENLDANFIVENPIPFTFPKESQDILDKAQIFCKSDFFIDQQVEITVDGRKIFFRAKSAGAWFEEWAKVEKSESFSTLIHPKFLQDILKMQGKCSILPGKMLKFEGDNWEHVAMLSMVA